MTAPSPHLERLLRTRVPLSAMQVAFVDIVAYSPRLPRRQKAVVDRMIASLRAARSATEKAHLDDLRHVGVDLRTDIIVLPSGDGAAVCFPFDNPTGAGLTFLLELFRRVHDLNAASPCEEFDRRSWCDCHDSFVLRGGLARGQVLLYRDYNDAYGVAGDAINTAKRVMDLADGRQIFVSQRAFDTMTGLSDEYTSDHFHAYRSVPTKHDATIDVHQLTDPRFAAFVDVAPRPDLPGPDASPPLSDVPEPSIDPSPSPMAASPGDPALPPVVPSPPSDSIEMVAVRPGSVTVPGASGPVEVQITRPFLIATVPVTKRLFDEVMGTATATPGAGENPADMVSWFEAVEFCNELSTRVGLRPVYVVQGNTVVFEVARDGFRLPTECEWEYAANGGHTGRGHPDVESTSWVRSNTKASKDVGQKDANGLGLHDMLGSVPEWCWDWYSAQFPPLPAVDPTGPPTGFERVLRGVSWRDRQHADPLRRRQRAAPRARDREDPHGFRVVRNADTSS